VALRFLGVSEHVPAAEQLHLVFARPRPCVLQFALEHQHDFLGVTPVERLVLRAVRALRKHVMSHAADAKPGVPECDRHARAEQGRMRVFSSPK